MLKEKMKRSLAALLAVVLLVFSAPLGGFVGLKLPSFGLPGLAANGNKADADDLTLEISDYGDWFTVTDCKQNAIGELIIPSEHEGVPVAAIGKYAFEDCERLTRITIPDSITNIGNRAFDDCRSLTSITIPNSVTSIGNYAFYNCNSLTSITIPDSVTSIGEGAFADCASLKSITIPDSITSIGGAAFDGTAWYNSQPDGLVYAGKVAYMYKGTMPDNTSLVLADGTKGIAGFAFYECTGLTSITIPASVASMACNAFLGCIGLTALNYYAVDCEMITGRDYFYHKDAQFALLKTVNIGAGVKTIPQYLFNSCISLESITIPNSVTSIGDYAFYDCSSLTSITIPDSVTRIGEGAFDGTAWYNSQPDGLVYAGKVAYEYKGTMPADTKIELAAGTTGIAGDAFLRCKTLTSITIPASVKIIGNGAFDFCEDLKEVHISDLAAWCSIDIGGFIYREDVNCRSDVSRPLRYTTKLYINGILAENIVIPHSVTAIKEYAFAWCSTIKSITIPDSVTEIRYSAFLGCTALTSITIPNSVTKIEWGAFYGCTALTSITIPNSETSISGYVFSDCTALTNVTIPDSVTSIGEGAFLGCTALTDVTIPNSVTSIGYKAFCDCDALTTVVIPDSVTHIGDGAFKGCSNLTEVKIGNSVQRIGKDAFNTCRKLKKVTIGASVVSIGEAAFLGDASLTSLTLPNSVEYIGPAAFSGCTGLTKVDLGNSVRSLGDYSFNYTGFSSITIPSSVTHIGECAFYNCKNLSEINVSSSNDEYSSERGVLFNKSKTELIVYPAGKADASYSIPGSVTCVDDDAFAYCTALQQITIPQAVTSVGDEAFFSCTGLTVAIYNAADCTLGTRNGNEHPPMYKGFFVCPSITTVYIGNTVERLPDYMFYGCTWLTNVIIPNSVTSIGSGAFWGCTALTSITIPNSVTEIDEKAFSGCTALTSITIPDSVTYIGQYAFDDTPWYNSKADGLVYAGLVAYKYKGTMEPGTAIGLAAGTTGIAAGAFSGCDELRSITIPPTVKSIGRYAFSGNSLDINIYDLATWFNIEFEDSSANPFVCGAERLLIAGEAVSDIVVPDTVTHIGNDQFAGCEWLTGITIGDSVTDIGDRAFYSCINLDTPVVADSVIHIGVQAFDNTKWVNDMDDTDIVYAGKVCCGYANAEKRENYTYWWYAILDDGTKAIADGAFAGVHHLGVIVPESVVYIGENSCSGSSILERVVIAGSDVEIGKNAFAGSEVLVIHCFDNSTAKSYALENSYEYHLFNSEPEVLYTANCSSQGELLYSCSECYVKHEVTVPIDPTKHEFYDEIAIIEEATCTTPGSKIPVCRDCGIHGAVEVLPIDPTAHAYADEWTVDTKATCSHTGSKSRHCIYCGAHGDVTTVPCDPYAHKFSAEWTVYIAPTYEYVGWKVRHCEYCDEVTDEIPIPRLASLEIESDALDVGNDVISGVRCGDTLSGTLSKLESSENIKVFNKNGTQVTDGEAKLGTGMVMKLFDAGGNVIDTVTVSVLGDTDGDGVTTTSDAREALRAAAKLESLPEEAKLAAEVDGDRAGISTSDARILLRVAARLETLTVD